MKKLTLTIVFVFVAILTCFAQETYKWKKEKIEVTLPKGWEIIKVEDDKITAKSDLAALEFMPMDTKTVENDDNAMAQLIPTIANNLEIDLSKGMNDEYECIKGAGAIVIAPHKTKDLMGVIALSASDKGNPYRYFAIVGLFNEEASDDIEEVIESLHYLD